MSKLAVKIIPGARHTQIDGWVDDRLKIRVTANPERGKANQAVIECLAEVLGIPKRDVRIASGARSSLKVIEVLSLSAAQIAERIGQRPTSLARQ